MNPYDLEFPSWVFFERSREIDGTWVAHVLSFDVVTQGESLEEAMSNAIDAATMVIVDDLKSHLSPYDRKAPEEYWNKLRDVIRRSEPKQLADVLRSQSDSGQVVMQLQFDIRVTEEPASGPLPPPERLLRAPQLDLDLAWAPQSECA